jgi:hypothetical protein
MSFITNKPTIGVINMRAYHFTTDTLKDGRHIPAVGEWLEHEGDIVPCVSGLHASGHPLDAVKYAPGLLLHLVELEGDLKSHGKPIDKWVGRRRKIIATINAEELLKQFARWCALQVIHLWNVPPVVREYLETGNEDLWEEARAAIEAVVWAPADDATWNAYWAAYWAVDEASYWAAAEAAQAENFTAKYRDKFQQMVDDAFMQN